jgi:predicted NodU family carbamoyl transferase
METLKVHTSAISHLIPHLAFREKAYFFPDLKDAEYIAINEAGAKNDFYPFHTTDEFRNAVQQTRDRSDYSLIYEKNQTLVFGKKINNQEKKLP